MSGAAFPITVHDPARLPVHQASQQLLGNPEQDSPRQDPGHPIQ